MAHQHQRDAHPRTEQANMGNSNQPAEGGSGGIASAIKDTVSDAANATSDFASQTAETAKQWMHQAGEVAVDAKDKAMGAVSQVGDKASNCTHDAIEMVRRYPIYSVAAAFVVGALVTKAMDSRR